MMSPRKRCAFACLWLLLALALAGCSASIAEMTATAAQGAALAELEVLRATGTVARARMQTTLDYADSRVTEAADAREFLRYSLINLGTESAYIATGISQLDALEGPATATAPAAARTNQPGATPATAAAAAIAVTPPATKRAGPRLEDLVMASGVDSSDCALDRNPRFTPSSQRIYVVARAFALPAGATISSVWRRGDSQVATFSFNPRNAINGDCIWFFIDQTDAEFTLNAWSVELIVNGEPAAPPLVFQIVAE